MNAYDGDLQLQHTEDGGDIEFVAGQPRMDGGIETAVYISLFTERGWWGNAAGDEAGSNLESILSDTLTTKTLNTAADEIRRALEWLISDGVASSVDVTVSAIGVYSVLLEIIISEPDALTPTTIRYRLNWDALRARMEVS
jgi:phage gp46-like protein